MNINRICLCLKYTKIFIWQLYMKKSGKMIKTIAYQQGKASRLIFTSSPSERESCVLRMSMGTGASPQRHASLSLPQVLLMLPEVPSKIISET